MKKQLVEFWYGSYGTHGRPVIWFKEQGSFNHRYIEMNDDEFSKLLKHVINDYLDYDYEVKWVRKEEK